jgi:NADPH2:quinone reductase
MVRHPWNVRGVCIGSCRRCCTHSRGHQLQTGSSGDAAGMTAHYLSHSAYPIRKGDEILVRAGAGDVGLLLIQMAKTLGARVTATVSTREKASLSLEAGADEVLQYTEVDFAKRINAAGRRMKSVHDSVGKTTFLKSLLCLEERGTVVLYGTAGGKVPPFDLEMLSTGSFYVTRPILKHYTATRSDLVSTGQLKLRIERSYSFSLADVEQAHRDLNGRKTTGKLLLLSLRTRFLRESYP